MAKPTNLPRWADVGGGAGGAGGGAVPVSTRLDTGWLYSERPTPRFFNWLFFTIYSWLAWMQEPKPRHIAMTTWLNRATVAPWSLSSSSMFWTSTGLAADTLSLWIPLPVINGDIVTGYRLTVRHPSVATAGTIEAEIHDLSRSSGGALVDGSPPGGSGLTSSAATTDRQYLEATGLTMAVEADHRYWIVVSGVNGGNVQRIVMEAEVSVIAG